jgi:SAM-dependent methyltransferase
MKQELLEVLRCPATGQRLVVQDSNLAEGEVLEGLLASEDGAFTYPITRGIPRFVPQSNYADNFGMQWNHFRQTQLDSYSGCRVSHDRFWKATGWSAADMKGKWLLDVGCGAGRFAEIALATGANVVALDYSSAVDACYLNLKEHPNLHVLQGDIYSLPFAPSLFSYVYSLGVLQHTPDVHKAFASLPPMVAQDGYLCVDYYEKSLKGSLNPRHYLRPVTKRMSKAALFSGLQKTVPAMLWLSDLLGRVPAVGSVLKRMIPVANHFDGIGLTERQKKEWALLDTFDWLSPQFDQPQSGQTAQAWMVEAGLKQIEVLRASHLVARGRK